MKNITSFKKRLIAWIKTLPSKKIYLEFFTALIGIPVAITWLILNINSVRNLYSDKITPTPTPKIQQKIIVIPQTLGNIAGTITVTPLPTTDSSTCIQQIGPITIDSPQEGETVNDNPVNVVIDYNQGNYCSVVWSYQINNGPWSDYNNDSVSLYNLPEGNITFNLMVKSTVTSQTMTLTRDFIYGGDGSIIPTPTIINTPTITPTPQALPTSQIATNSAS